MVTYFIKPSDKHTLVPQSTTSLAKARRIACATIGKGYASAFICTKIRSPSLYLHLVEDIWYDHLENRYCCQKFVDGTDEYAEDWGIIDLRDGKVKWVN